MDRENGKRKAAMSPGDADAVSRGNKAKKPNPPPVASGSTKVTSNTNSEAPRGSELTQKLVAMWVGGTDGHHPFMTQEVRESMALREAQKKCLESENLVHTLQNKMKNAEAVINDLNKSLRAEERIKLEMISKTNFMSDLTATITEHINYIIDTLQRCQRHKDHLSDLYNTIILKQREDYGRLKNREETLQERINDLRSTVFDMEKNLEKVHNVQEEKSNQLQRAFETELAKAHDECAKMRKHLEEIDEEKKNIQNRLMDKESYSLELERKIMEYENGLKNLKEQLEKASTDLESIATEKSQLENELVDKNCEILKICGDLENATTERNEQLAKMSTISDKNNELEEKIKCEVDQRQSLAKCLKETSERNEELARQVEKLKDEKEEAVREMKKKIESAERESKRILSEAKKETDELESKQDRLLKIHVEKYESCLAEMKLLEAHHQSELSRVSNSSNSTLLNVKMENRKLEEAISCLKREKNDLQVELQQIEDLLKKHMTSEKQLREKFDQCQAEAAKYAAAAATAQVEKKRGEDENQAKICKIKELEKELLNLQFNRKLATPRQKPGSTTSDDSIRKTKEHAKKPMAASTYKKSILKSNPKPRKTRSTPPSPVTVVPPAPTTFNRKITFNFDSSSEESPVKLLQTSDIIKFMDSSDPFDELAGIGRSSSQPMQSSQTLNSQNRPETRKFFKSRASQSK